MKNIVFVKAVKVFLIMHSNCFGDAVHKRSLFCCLLSSLMNIMWCNNDENVQVQALCLFLKEKYILFELMEMYYY